MGGKVTRVSEAKQNKIRQLLLAGVSLNQICKQLRISNTPVYKLAEREGIRYRKKMDGKRQVAMATVVDDFVCPGLSGCVTCKRIFQYPCPFAPDNF